MKNLIHKYMNIIKHEDGLFVSAKEIYKGLGIRKEYANWVKQSFKRAFMEADKDYLPQKAESTGGRPSRDYLLTEDSAITVILMSGGQFAKQLRDQCILLFKQYRDGLLFNPEQIFALIDISKSMTLISIQKEVEKKHFDLHNNKYDWYSYRATLLGYDTKQIIQAMRDVNKKHHSIKTSLIQLDANELIRTGVIDLLIILGRTSEYATRVGDTCKGIAQKMKLGNIIWDDTVPNPLGINKSEVTERKQLFNQSIKSLK